VTGIFPLGGPVGAQTAVELTGWNLPVTNLTANFPGQEPGIYPLSIPKAIKFTITSHSPWTHCRNAWSRSRMIHRKPPRPLRLPVIVNGRIDHPGDWDVFRFEGRTGDLVVAEVYARRLDSPLDSVLKLTDAGGKQLAFNDDYEDKGSGLNTHHADSYFSTVLPTNEPIISGSATPSTRAVRNTATVCASVRLSPISRCGSSRPASTSALAGAFRSPFTPCARTGSPTRLRWFWTARRRDSS